MEGNYLCTLMGVVTNQEPRRTIGYCLENNDAIAFQSKMAEVFSGNQEPN